MFLLCTNLQENLIAFISQDDNSFVTIQNLATHKQQLIKEQDLCPAAFKGECVDSCSIDKNKFYIYWQGSKWNREKRDTREKTYNIDL